MELLRDYVELSVISRWAAQPASSVGYLRLPRSRRWLTRAPAPEHPLRRSLRRSYLHRLYSGFCITSSHGACAPFDERQQPAMAGSAQPEARGRTASTNPVPRGAATCSEPSAFEHRAAQRAKRFETEGDERGSGGGQLPTARQSTSRVHRVADFAEWATQVAEASKADVAAASATYDWREERHRRRSAVHTAPTGEAKDGLIRVSVDRSTPRSTQLRITA